MATYQSVRVRLSGALSALFPVLHICKIYGVLIIAIRRRCYSLNRLNLR